MSLSNRLQRLGFIVLTLGSLTALSACTLTPVYSGRLAESPLLNFAYAKPNSRLEQIIYQDLALRLGASDSPTAPLATVVAYSGAGDLMLSRSANPNIAAQVTVYATLTITSRDGSNTPPLVITRQAAAQYTRNGQVFAEREAAIEAAERAATAAAESLRLAVLASQKR